MFSLSKILALVAILAAVWYGFKLITRLDQARRRRDEVAARDKATRATERRGEEPADGVLDLVQDERGNYVAKDKRDDRV